MGGLATAVIALGIGVGFGLASQKDISAQATRTQALDELSSRRSQALVANVAFGVAVVGALCAALGWMWSDFALPTQGAASQARLRLGLGVSGSGMRLQVQDSF